MGKDRVPKSTEEEVMNEETRPAILWLAHIVVLDDIFGSWFNRDIHKKYFLYWCSLINVISKSYILSYVWFICQYVIGIVNHALLQFSPIQLTPTLFQTFSAALVSTLPRAHESPLVSIFKPNKIKVLSLLIILSHHILAHLSFWMFYLSHTEVTTIPWTHFGHSHLHSLLMLFPQPLMPCVWWILSIFCVTFIIWALVL